MDAILDFFGEIGEWAGRSIGAIILFIGSMLVVVWIGQKMGLGLLWIMKSLNVRNYTLETFIENHSGFFPIYLIMLWLLSIIFF